jgi:2,3-bisphosphoglycerate-independent phosphoglycerate mutase
VNATGPQNSSHWTPSQRRQLLYLVLDGLGDEPSEQLGGRTPLQVARTPHLDALAREGEVSRLLLADSEGTASTHVGQLALLGYDDRQGTIPRRGPIEAAATGLVLEPGDVALRANFATLDPDGLILDRRAGRIRDGAEELCQSLDGMDLGDGVTALVRGATEHRAVVVLRGPGLSSRVADSDPKSLAHGPVPPLRTRPLDPADEAAARTAAKLELFLERARSLLQQHPVNLRRSAAGQPLANALLLRQAGCHQPLAGLRERFGLRCAGVAAERTVIGVLRLLGADVLTRPEFTANTDTFLAGKFDAAVKLLEDAYDVVLIHVKATDILGHDQKPHQKAQLIEAIDGHLGRTLELLADGTLVALASDHSTSSTTGDHILAPVPALLWGEGIAASGVPAFDEPTLEQAQAPQLQGSAFFFRVLEALGRKNA